MFKLQRGDLVCDLNKDPEPSINMGKVEEVLAGGVVRVTWKDGTTSERPVRRLAKISPPKSSYKMPPAVRKEMWDKFLQMSDEDIDAEIARLDRKLNLN
jgi:hypothetical protein